LISAVLMVPPRRDVCGPVGVVGVIEVVATVLLSSMLICVPHGHACDLVHIVADYVVHHNYGLVPLRPMATAVDPGRTGGIRRGRGVA
jgi:hypothetical protein